MPFAQNPVDGCRVYFEDDGGLGPPVVILNGLGDPIAASREWAVTSALAPDYRLILIDHRGHGRADKPHDAAAYKTRLRVADVVAVLDALDIARAHLIGISWGARLLFGFGELAAGRARSLTMGGQTPYAMNPDSPGVRMVTEAFRRGRSMEDFVEALGGLGEVKDSVREYTMANDFAALAAAWRCAMDEGAVARKLSEWRLPCLIYAGTEDVDFFPDAQRVAKEIPGARFLALEGLSHLEAHANVIDVLPHIRALLSQS